MSDSGERVRELRQASERISANLVDLELDSSRRLLDTTRLSGESAERWNAANAALTELWRRHGLLEDLLLSAEKLRTSRRATELHALLEGPSVELASVEVPLAERSLLQTPERVTRCSAEELLMSMSAAFDEVKAVVSGIGRAWETLVPKLDAARRLLAARKTLADELGESERSDLAAAARTLETLSSSITRDPLSVRTEVVDELELALRAINADLERTAELKRQFDTRMLAARELLEQLRSADRELRTAREELLVKIASPPAAPSPGAPDQLESELEQVPGLARHGAWRAVRTSLEEWTARATAMLGQARQALEAQRAPIEARNQFRALLEAYQAKARWLGLIEDPALEEIFARARATLYTAPTDLAVAARLVRSYQQALSGLPPTVEEAR